ncbi:nitroreductase family protein [Mucilaginibacter ginsenosidivorans]|uniref:Nitroreductase n=1 Tax=Mucilaginibacter ginsenosidivorans TaxID=398053 RepID=A0A5B8UXF4_9SPHI|nr:nitroreductase [Mucilaginibacter ginsenosidivorans]QEC63734.1 nitroreductase [Mucilaginibacter ginsenosidivorans]
MDNIFATISNIITSRRSTKPAMMNGKKAPDYQVQSLLDLADWAPTHGYTEPWRFTVYSNPPDFCRQHAELYKQNVEPENFAEGVYQNLYTQGDKASHVIIVTMKRGNLPKIPVVEEMEAVACSVQNILLGATALGMASFWSTGGMALRPPMKNFLHLGEDDHVAGIIYLGYADKTTEGSRTIPIEEKIIWFK